MRDGWVETTLGEISALQMGRTPSRRENSYWTDDLTYPFCTIADMDAKYVEPKREGVTKAAIMDGKAKMATKGTLLMSFKLTIGRMGFAARDIFPNEAIVMIEADESKVLNEFLYLRLASMDLTEGSGRAVKGSTLNSASIASIAFLVPPLPEQKRIVDLISSVDSYIEALQQQLESTKKSRNAYVNTIVFETFARGKKTKIADIAEVKGGKRLPKGTPWSEEPTDHRYIRATDIKDGIILTENLVYVPDDVWPVISRYVVNQGDVVITIAGTIGQVGVIPASLDGVNLTENAAKIVVDRKLVRSNYLGMLLGSTYYQQDIDSKTKKTTQPKLGLNMINSIEIPLPELAEQDEIFSVVSHFDSLIATTKDQITKANTLRSGLLANLLSGEHEIPESYDKAMSAA